MHITDNNVPIHIYTYIIDDITVVMYLFTYTYLNIHLYIHSRWHCSGNVAIHTYTHIYAYIIEYITLTMYLFTYTYMHIVDYITLTMYLCTCVCLPYYLIRFILVYLHKFLRREKSLLNHAKWFILKCCNLVQISPFLVLNSEDYFCTTFGLYTSRTNYV